MSFENKGSMPVTVYVTRDPDRSGNWICNGTDDQVEINAAITLVNALGGGIVQLGYGTFNVSTGGYDPILTRSGVWLRGSGMGATKIDHTTNNIPDQRGGIENANRAATTIDNYMIISNLEMEGPGDDVGNMKSLIQWSGVQYSIINQCYLHDSSGYAVRLLGNAGTLGVNKHIWLTENIIANFAYNFISCGNFAPGDCEYIYIMDNHVDNTDTGISLFDARRCIIARNQVINTTNEKQFTNGVAIALEGTTDDPTEKNIVADNVCVTCKGGVNCSGNKQVINNIIIGNTIISGIDNAGKGITLGGGTTQRNMAVGNHIDGTLNSNPPFTIDGDRNLVANNFIINSKAGHYAFVVTGDKNNIIGNYAYNCSYGLVISDASYNKIQNNTFYGDNTSIGIWIDASGTPNGNIIEENFIENFPTGIRFNTGTGNRVFDNDFVSVTTCMIDNGTDTIFRTVMVPFVEPIGTATWDVNPPCGIEVNAVDEGAFTMGSMPPQVYEVVQVRVYAVGLAAPGVGNAMEIEFNLNSGRPDEVYNSETVAVANKDSDQTNFAVNDIVTWTLTDSDDPDIDDLVDKDCFEILVMHEVGADTDIDTNALFRCVEIHYV